MIGEDEILKKNLSQAAEWIALTESGAILMKYLFDDFYRACLYFVGKAYARALGLAPDESVSLDELDSILTQSDAETILRRLLGEGFIAYKGENRYVVNYLKLGDILEAVKEYTRIVKI